MDKCNIYDFDYKTLSQMAIDDGKTVEDYGEIPTTKNCTEFVFDNKLSFDNSSFTYFLGYIYLLIGPKTELFRRLIYTWMNLHAGSLNILYRLFCLRFN